MITREHIVAILEAAQHERDEFLKSAEKQLAFLNGKVDMAVNMLKAIDDAPTLKKTAVPAAQADPKADSRKPQNKQPANSRPAASENATDSKNDVMGIQGE